MAGDWIHVRVNLRDDVAVISMAKRLGIDRDAMVGKLVRFWSWADQQVSGGRVDGVVDADVDALVDAREFCNALLSVGWLRHSSDGSILIPGWDTWFSDSAKARMAKTKRQGRWRSKHVDGCVDADVDAYVDGGSSTAPSTRGEERRVREEDPPPSGDPVKSGGGASRRTPDRSNPTLWPLPEVLAGGKLPEAWKAWTSWKAARGRPITKESAESAFCVFEEHGAEVCANAIRKAIASGYEGFTDSIASHDSSERPAYTNGRGGRIDTYVGPACATCGWKGSGEALGRCRACGRAWIDGRSIGTPGTTHAPSGARAAGTRGTASGSSGSPA